MKTDRMSSDKQVWAQTDYAVFRPPTDISDERAGSDVQVTILYNLK